jgi:hypothetical protein
MIVRQGDVLVARCDKIPATAKPVDQEDGRLIVARGEATGHHHSFPHRPEIALFRDGTTGPFYVRAAATVALEHQEHTALEIPAGIYRVTIQRTFSAGTVRRVED